MTTATPATFPSEVEFELRKLIVRYSAMFDQHQWASERQRWVELAFALVTRISKRPEAEIRRAVEELNLIGLLELDELASLAEGRSAIDFQAVYGRRIEQHLRDRGFNAEETRDVLVALHEVAAALVRQFDGHVQRYLRRYGELMLREVPEHFRFSRLSPDATRSAFGYWLQNVLAMPVPADTDAVRGFCGRLGITPEQLIEKVDKLGLNLALADDMIELGETDRSASAR